ITQGISSIIGASGGIGGVISSLSKGVCAVGDLFFGDSGSSTPSVFPAPGVSTGESPSLNLPSGPITAPRFGVGSTPGPLYTPSPFTGGSGSEPFFNEQGSIPPEISNFATDSGLNLEKLNLNGPVTKALLSSSNATLGAAGVSNTPQLGYVPT